MNLVRTIAMNTDHDVYGHPVETTTVELYCDRRMTPEQVEIAKRNQEKALLATAKRMPHRFWNAAHPAQQKDEG
jgi:hypothetical protein